MCGLLKLPIKFKGELIMKFHHKPASFVQELTLKVKDLKRSIKFYKEIMGFTVIHQEEEKVVFSVNGKDPILTLITFNSIQGLESRKTGLYHFAILLEKRTDLAKFIRHLIKSNFPLPGAADHHVSEALYFNDPDGNGIEVYYDRSSEDWIWKDGEVHMVTDQVDFNDIMSTLDNTVWEKAPSTTVLGHIHLHVRDLNESEKFYKDLLGLDVVCRYGGQALFLSFNKYHHHIGLNTWNGLGAPAPSENSVGLESYKLVYGTNDLLQSAIKRLEEVNYPITKEGNSFIVKDPSSNKLILTV